MEKITDKSFQTYLCYLLEDKFQANAIAIALQKLGVNVWTSENNILPGQLKEDEIHTAIEKSDVVLVCLSNNFSKKEGSFYKELNIALDIAKEKPEGMIYIIPIRLEECNIPQSLSKFKPADIFKREKYSKLIKSIEEKAKKAGKEIKGKRDEAYLIYKCDYCKRNINPTKSEGHIYISHRDILATKQKLQSRDALDRNFTPLDEYPYPAQWKIEHYDCSQQDDVWYSIEIYRIRTFQQVIEWTSHLMIKNWIGNTNWFEIIRNIAKNVKTKTYQ